MHTEAMLSKDTFIHSNHTSPNFQKLLKSLNITQSMSRHGNC
ncbi:hypothetical protein [Cetobacterium sp. ZWU0022]|nr:hypothetical protein [Cetobacterium sp. ZWU0022]